MRVTQGSSFNDFRAEIEGRKIEEVEMRYEPDRMIFRCSDGAVFSVEAIQLSAPHPEVHVLYTKGKPR